MAPTMPLFAPTAKLAATPPPSNTAVTVAKDKTKTTKLVSSEKEFYLSPEDKKNLQTLLDDQLVKDKLSLKIQDKIRTIIRPSSDGKSPTGQIMLTKEEAFELRDFMTKHGAEGHFTEEIKKSTQNLLKETAGKLGGQWVLMFTVSLAAMVASGAIAAAAAG